MSPNSSSDTLEGHESPTFFIFPEEIKSTGMTFQLRTPASPHHLKEIIPFSLTFFRPHLRKDCHLPASEANECVCDGYSRLMNESWSNLPSLLRMTLGKLSVYLTQDSIDTTALFQCPVRASPLHRAYFCISLVSCLCSIHDCLTIRAPFPGTVINLILCSTLFFCLVTVFLRRYSYISTSLNSLNVIPLMLSEQLLLFMKLIIAYTRVQVKINKLLLLWTYRPLLIYYHVVYFSWKELV